jgi:hypothetical protein
VQRIVCGHVQYSLRCNEKGNASLEIQHSLSTAVRSDSFSRVVQSESPVRIDWAGGWSDTPPVCYSLGGSV